MAGVMNPGQRRTLMDDVAQGLAIAESVYGIKSKMDEQDYRDEQRAKDEKEKVRVASGAKTPGELQDLMIMKGLVPAKEGEDGAYAIKTVDGPLAYAKKASAPKIAGTKVVETVDPKTGKAGHMIVEDKAGAFYPAPPPKPAAEKEDKTPANTAELRKEYNSQATTKSTFGVVESYKKIQQNINNPNPTGASDMSLVYSFMKMNDPNSTVREGEYATAENSGGVSDKIVNLYNKLRTGERLTPEQRANFAAEAEGLLSAQLDAQQAIDQRYADIASQFKLDSKYVIEPSFGSMKKGLGVAKTGQGAQAAGEAFAAPSGGAPAPSLNDIEAELKRRGVK